MATFAQFYLFLKTHTLPVYNWAPFDLSSMTVFVPMLIYQSVTLCLCANSSVAHETLISGLMIQICAQFEILCHRAHMLPILLMEAEKNSQSEQDLKARERLIIRDLIEHHLYVYKWVFGDRIARDEISLLLSVLRYSCVKAAGIRLNLPFARSCARLCTIIVIIYSDNYSVHVIRRLAHTVNAVFTLIMFIQFSMISLVLCLSVYKISNMTTLLTLDFAYVFSYLGSMLTQIFLYCWYGNEISLKVNVMHYFFSRFWVTGSLVNHIFPFERKKSN